MEGARTRLRPPPPLWRLPADIDPDAVEALAVELGLPPALCSVLVVRGHVDLDGAKRFLRPRLDHLHDPQRLADGPKAAERIVEAIRAGETILVHGDYDVDGICGASLYARWIGGLGGRVVPFVPHRLRDGYDLGEAGIRAARDAGARLILTADCGTVAHDAIARAAAEGIDVIVTDHHSVGGGLPPALAVVNPQREDCAYPDKSLCGTGIAFKVCRLVGDLVGADPAELNAYLDLVALATVADLVPLEGENRILVRFGLRRLGQTRLPGLRALLEVSRLQGEPTAGQVGFVVAPRINAAGRVGESADALRLLMTEDPDEARRLAEQLDEINRVRREEDRRIFGEAIERLEGRYDPDADFGLVLAAEGWHPGVIGIVASRVVEQVHRPVVLIALSGTTGRGSARSIPGFDLYAALAACSSHMVRFGGHKQAAGMDVRADAVPALSEAFNAQARSVLAGDGLSPVLRADVELGPADAGLDLVRWLEYLGPHGIGNPGPVFLARRVAVEGARTVGEGHLKVRLCRDGSSLEAIGFGLAERHPPDRLVGPHDVLFKLDRNEYRGVVRAQARLLDLRPAASA